MLFHIYFYVWGKSLPQVDQENSDRRKHIFGNALVVDLELNERSDYEFGNALVTRTSLIEMECANFLKIVDLVIKKHPTPLEQGAPIGIG